MSDLTEPLRAHFGFSEFRAGQREVIASLLAGRPALAVFPTGGGKSLCYQLPAVLLEGLTLVVSPLIALMKDQVDSLRQRGIAAARLDSTLTAEEANAIYDQLYHGTLKLLYVAPERLANENFRARLARTRISLLAIDEAHCISEWGHNFRPDYLKLARFARDLGIERILALTATATPAVAADIRANFQIAERDHTQLSFHRPNLALRVTPCLESEKRQRLLDLLQESAGDPASHAIAPTIIYGTRQETAESLAAFLKRNGLPARPYHAGLRDETRATCQEAFMSGEAPIITATIAFGMGIDKADIRRIIHYNLPKSLENYTQEIGRAGRDGHPAHVRTAGLPGRPSQFSRTSSSATRPHPKRSAAFSTRSSTAGTSFDLSQYESGWHPRHPAPRHQHPLHLPRVGGISSRPPIPLLHHLSRSSLLRDLERSPPRLRRSAADQRFLRELFATGKSGTHLDRPSIPARPPPNNSRCERERSHQGAHLS